MKKEPLRERLIYIAEYSKNIEYANSAMQQLKKDFNKTYHWCPDWDYMVICNDDKESDGCTCEIKNIIL